MNYIVSALIALITVAGGFFVKEQVAPTVGASQSISSLTELTSLSHNDVLPITEANGLTTKKVKWGTATSTLKVINDALYSPIIGSASITTLGTITTGTWNADTLTVSKGGTGSTSLIAYQLLAGNGTGAVTTFGNGTSGYVLTSNGAGALPSFQNVAVTLNGNNTWTGTNSFSNIVTLNSTTTFNATSTFNGPIVGSVNVQTFTSSSTWYKPSQTSSSSSVFVECWGAGGAGAGSDSTNTRGGGGGGGAYLSKKFIASELSSTVTVTIGSGGLGVLDGSGNAGGNTTFGSYLTSYGGGGGGKGTAGGGGGGAGVLGAGGNSTSNTGAAGGGPNGGAANGSADFGGGGGGTAAGGGLSSYGGGGGGSTAAGGGSVYGGGGGGGGQTATQTSGGSSVFGGAGGASGNDANGSNGSVPGGGGGGTYSSASNYTGGNGANGKCIVTTHI